MKYIGLPIRLPIVLLCALVGYLFACVRFLLQGHWPCTAEEEAQYLRKMWRDIVEGF